jgi:PAS domain S-box-containing protein
MHDFPKLFEGHYEYVLREVLESVNDAVVVFTHDLKIGYANKAAEDVFGGAKGRLVGENLGRLIPKDRIAHFNDIVAKLQASEHHELQLQGSKEFVGMRAHDHFFYAEGKLAKFKDEAAYILVLRDITWRKAVEGELETMLVRLRKVDSKIAYRLEHPKIVDEFPMD